MGCAGFGVGGYGLEGSQTMVPEIEPDSAVCDRGHMHWSLNAQDVLALPFNNAVTLTSYLIFFVAQFVHL